MKNKLLYIILAVLITKGVSAQEFPYYTYGNVSSEFTVLQASLGAPTIVEYTTREGVVLTLDKKDQYAGVYLKNLKFPTNRGFEIEFEYNNQALESSMGAGDGFALVLFDSEAAREGKVQMGVAGAGLGYNHRRISGKTIEGFSNGYFGIGFDSYGGYKLRLIEPNEDTNGLPSANFTTDAKKSSHITIRGPFYKGANGATDIKKGYPVLFTRSTIDKQSDSKVYILNKDGGYTTEDNSRNVAYIDIKNNKETNLQPTDEGYRKAIIKFLKGTSTENGNIVDGYYMFLNLLAYDQGKSINIPVLSKFFVKKSGSIKYQEYDYKATSSRIDNLYYTIPSTLRLAFTASTGGAYQKQSVRNIKVRIPYSPQTADISLNNVSRNDETTFDALVDAIGFNTNVYDPINEVVGNKSYLDLKTFRFKRMDETTGKFVFTSDPYEISSSQGTYNYNPMTGLVSFNPSSSVATSVTSDVVYFDIKNKPTTVVGSEDISVEVFRSNTTKITLNFGDSGSKKYIIVNANPVQL